MDDFSFAVSLTPLQRAAFETFAALDVIADLLKQRVINRGIATSLSQPLSQALFDMAANRFGAAAQRLEALQHALLAQSLQQIPAGPALRLQVLLGGILAVLTDLERGHAPEKVERKIDDALRAIDGPLGDFTLSLDKTVFNRIDELQAIPPEQRTPAEEAEIEFLGKLIEGLTPVGEAAQRLALIVTRLKQDLHDQQAMLSFLRGFKSVLQERIQPDEWSEFVDFMLKGRVPEDAEKRARFERLREILTGLADHIVASAEKMIPMTPGQKDNFSMVVLTALVHYFDELGIGVKHDDQARLAAAKALLDDIAAAITELSRC